MNGRTGVRQAFSDLLRQQAPTSVGIAPDPRPFLFIDLEEAGRSEVAPTLEAALPALDRPTLVLVVSASPSAASAADGDELGTRDRRLGPSGRAACSRGRASCPHLRFHSPCRRRRRRRPGRDGGRMAEPALRRRLAGRAHRRAGAAGSLRALSRAATARGPSGRRRVGADGDLRPCGGPRAGVPPTLVPTYPHGGRGARRLVALARPRAPARGAPALPHRRDSGPVPARSDRHRRSVHAMGGGASGGLRRRGCLRRRHPGGPRRRSRVRLGGGRDSARRGRAIGRRPLLRDAEHRDRHRPRVRVVRRTAPARGRRRGAPRDMRPRGRLAVDRLELRRGDHALRRRRPVARDQTPPAVVDGRLDHRRDHRDRRWRRSR